ncbi:MAG: patatin-like phospholipase family protein [Hyphomicrobiaceae bacterium]
MTRPRIGLALGSGSARGWAHIGVIDALTEAGIRPDIVCGASMGALVGAAHVAGRLAELRQWAGTATWRTIARLTDLRLTGGGLISGRQVMSFLQGMGIGEPIESYATHYAAVATDMATGREIWLQSGPIHEAVRASIAIPGIFSPARMDGKWLLDGGLSNPIPVSVCRALGADVIIAVNLNGELVGRRFTEPEPPDETRPSRLSVEVVRRMLGQWPITLPKTLPATLRRRPGTVSAPPESEPALAPAPADETPPPPRESVSAPGYFGVLATASNIMQDHITRARLAGEPPHVMLLPRLRSIGLMEFNRAEEAIAEGRSCVEQALPTLRRYL